MKIALFYPRNTFAGWYVLGGYVNTLRKMGHEVIDCPFPGNQVTNVEKVRESLPKSSELSQCDCVLATYLEYLQPWLTAVYGLESWSQVIKSTCVLGRLDESFLDRPDLGLPQRWEEIKQYASHFFFPAAQDAQRFGGEWLPYGSDIEMFKPYTGLILPEKKYDVGFVGQLYPVRQRYLEQLAMAPGGEGMSFDCAQALVQDLSGIREPESTLLMAENYRQLKIFFCLPPIDKMIVAKAMDIMACGTFLMYPKYRGEAGKNMSLFQDGSHLAYYEPGYMMENLEQIRYWLTHENEREAIAKLGCDFVHKQLNLEWMLQTMLAKVGASV